MLHPSQAGVALGSARAGRGLVHLHPLSGPDLNQKFDAIITANASSVCYTSRLKALCSRQQPYSGAVPSAARFRPGDGQVESHDPALTSETFGPFMPQPEPGPRWARAERGLLSGPDSDQKFHVIIAANVSSVCILSDESSVFQAADDVQMTQMTLSRAQSYPRAEPSVAHFRSGTDRCKRVVPRSHRKFLRV